MAVPAAPVITGVTSGDNQASVAFTQAVATPAVSKHQIKVSGANYKDCSSVSPVIVKGLMNGTPYTFTMRAVNADGNSVASNVAGTTPIDTNPNNNNGWDDASFYANAGMVPNLDWFDPDD